MSEAVEATGKISELGTVAILLFFILLIVFGVGTTVRYLMKRLFDEEKGIITKLSNKHLEAVDKLISSTEANVQATKKIDSHVVRIDRMLSVSAEDFQKFRHVWIKYVKMLRKIAIHINIGDIVSEDLDRIETLLDSWDHPKVIDE